MARQRRGIIFVTAMWIMLILGALVLVFARSMQVESTASANRLAQQQASTIELGAEQYVVSAVDACGGDAVAVLQTPGEQLKIGDGYFWLLQVNPDDDYDYAFGITDECAKLNLNVAADAEIASLPGMSQEIADAIVDWRDTDDVVTGQGAESDYYQSLPRPYRAKNGPLETVEELYLVKGVSDSLLWGYDLDHNGMIDSTEQSAGGLATAFNSATDTSRGIFPFATVWGKEPNTTTSGKARINIANLAGPGQLQPLLAKYFPPQRVNQIMARAMQFRLFRNPFDFSARTGMTSAELAKIIDSLSATPAKTLSGLVNVNTAPQQVLMCLPGISQIEAESLIAQRPTSTSASSSSGASSGASGLSSALGGSSSSGSSTSIAWVMDAIGPQKAAAVGGRLTGRSYFYSADIVAVSGNGRSFRRVRVVVDARSSPPIIIYRKDLSNLGWPLSNDIRTALRTGQQLPAPSGLGTGGANGLAQ